MAEQEPYMNPDLHIHAERTSDPNSIRWVLDRPVVASGGRASFASASDLETSPLASRLFSVEGVTGAVLGPDFATVTKRQDLEWADLVPGVVAGIRSWAESGEPALGPAYVSPRADEDPQIVARIRDILESEIGPYVAQDGGEIAFVGYANGVVEVALRGACAGCPSSTITLKMGVEDRLKREIPEVIEVVAV
jgi:Fe-S cluster biogenesis protein NfuA